MNKKENHVGRVTGNSPTPKKGIRLPQSLNAILKNTASKIKSGVIGDNIVDDIIVNAYIQDSCKCCTDFQESCINCSKISNFGLERG